MAEDLGTSLGWEEEIDAPDNEFEPLPEGVYSFEVQAVDRQQFNGSAKMAPCPMAHVHARILDEPYAGRVVFSNLMLNSKVAWKIKQFFVCLGMHPADAPKEQRVRMDWSHAIGRRGRVKLKTREYNGRTYNDVDEWLKPGDGPAAQPMAQPVTYVPPANAAAAPAQVQQAINQAVMQAQQQAARPATTPGKF